MQVTPSYPLNVLFALRCWVWVAKTGSPLKPLTIRPKAWILPGSMLRLLVALLPTLRAALRSRRDLVIENLALRQQLAPLAGRRHPVIRPADRLFWILLRRLWSGWVLDRLLESYIAYYNEDRTHLSICKDSPLGRPAEQRPTTPATVVGLPRVSGLHRRYAWRRAA